MAEGSAYRMRKLWAALAALLLLTALLLTSGCTKSEIFTGFYMDTFVELTASGKSVSAQKAIPSKLRAREIIDLKGGCEK